MEFYVPKFRRRERFPSRRELDPRHMYVYMYVCVQSAGPRNKNFGCRDVSLLRDV